MIVTINQTTGEVLGYATIGGAIDTEDSENYSYEWNGVKPEPPHQYEAYDSDGWKIRKKTTTKIDSEATALKWSQVRSERNTLLKKSDGMALRQSEQSILNDTDWTALKKYRQDLRDIPEDNSDPFNITWPTWPLDE